MRNKGPLIILFIMVAVILISIAMLYIVPEKNSSNTSSLSIDGPMATDIIFLSFPQSIENVVEVLDNKNAMIQFGSTDEFGLNSGVDILFIDAFSISNTGTMSVTASITKTGKNAEIIDFGTLEEGVEIEPGEVYSCTMHINTQNIRSENEILKNAVIWIE